MDGKVCAIVAQVHAAQSYAWRIMMKVRNIVLVLLLCLMQMLLPAGAWGEEVRLIEQGNACYEAKDYEKAMEFYLRSVEEEDDPGALFNIGVLYAQGSGVEKDPAAALEWFRKAADRGISDAMHNLGCLYLAGEGTDQSNGQAIFWFRKAAEAGNAAAMYNLGYMTVHGLGVDADPAAGYDWLKKALEKGYEPAQAAMDSMVEQGLYEPDPYPCPGVTLRGDLEVKRSPNPNAGRDAVLRADRHVTVLGVEEGWYRISVDLDGTRSVEGYVPMDTIELSK